MVRAEVAEVEERIAHPGIFPVDDPDAPAVVDEVRVEQVVVTRPELDRVAEEGELDPTPDRLGEPELDRDRDAAGKRQGAVGLDDPERAEQAGDRRAVVDWADRVGGALDR